MSVKKPNRLISEKSPYLLQHAYNPVDWHAWNYDTFKKAEEEDKPVFLSIGYSTCHWCHVMEKESFEDPEVARLMNDAFISVKVDREERPDLDHIYMMVCQMMTRSGGWPLTIVMTPDKRPFFAGTYIPKETRFGRVGMTELIPKIKEIWSSRRPEVMDSAEKILTALKSVEAGNPGGDLDRSVLEKAYREFAQRFDLEHGGFGGAPKFPTPHNFMFLLRHWKRSGSPQALEMVEKTLQEMRRGGIYDHIGYGFHRYSTDKEWLVPHFEKMLYDQALLAMAYLEAYQATRDQAYAATAKEIFTYVLRDMKAPEGAFYSAEDADSEGVEGKFYLWKEEEVRKILEGDEAELVVRVFNIEKKGNFKDEATGLFTGANILHLAKPLHEVAADLGMSKQELESRIESARRKLLEARGKRIRPYKDDKILTDWNGLMIAALSRGARIFGEPEYAAAAKAAADFVLKKMRKADGRLVHRYREGEADITAHLDDYTSLVWGLTELYQATLEPRYLKDALELNEDMLTHYWDERSGGLFFTPDDGEKLLVRKKETYDGAVPSGNSVAMLNLLRLARLTARPELDEKAMRIGRAFSGEINQIPSAYTMHLVSTDFAIGPSYEVVIAGSPGAEDTREMLKALNTQFIPNHVLLFRPAEPDAEVDNIAGFIHNHQSLDGKATAYVCIGHACKAPTTSAEDMLNLMK